MLMSNMKKLKMKTTLFTMFLFIVSISKAQDGAVFKLEKIVPVEGRQGIAASGKNYYVSGSKALYKYDSNWKLTVENLNPFEGLEDSLNHLGDIDVYDDKIYAGTEFFANGRGKNIQIAVYSSSTLLPLTSIKIDTASGQREVSGIAVDKIWDIIWLSDWVDGQSLYKYELSTGRYLGKVKLNPVPQLQQGIAFFDNHIFITVDDGDAELMQHDNLYSIDASDLTATQVFVSHEKTFNEFIRPGEIEGISFNTQQSKMFVLFNRGTKIIKGMPVGFYPGYEKEIHEVYIYSIINK